MLCLWSLALCSGAVAMIAAGSANEAVVEECHTMLQSLGCYCFTLGQVCMNSSPHFWVPALLKLSLGVT